MPFLLCGLETEYGLWVEESSVENQIEHSKMLVGSCTEEHFFGWNYRYESPRNDLRGFQLKHLAVDPIDAKFDRGGVSQPAEVTRNDRVLANGARFYNDHGHPEFSTPECDSLDLLLREIAHGDDVVFRAAQSYSAQINRDIRIYKHNSDYHGSSFGTHENYLFPRSVPIEKLITGLIPLLVARPALCGAGKIGSESGSPVDYQLSQRADFFVEPVNAETLYRRPIFNTRDEPHADPELWIRVHVIAGDANRAYWPTRLKFLLAQLALNLILEDKVPDWLLDEPVKSIQLMSRDLTFGDTISTHRGRFGPLDILESYLEASRRLVDFEFERYGEDILFAQRLIESIRSKSELHETSLDWAIKRKLLHMICTDEGWNWQSPELKSYDLGYHLVDPDESLYDALLLEGEILSPTLDSNITNRRRASVRAHAVKRFPEFLSTVCWRTLTFRIDDKLTEVELLPDVPYGETFTAERLANLDVVSYINLLQELNDVHKSR